MRIFDISKIHPLGQLLVLLAFIVAGTMISWFLLMIISVLMFESDISSLMNLSANVVGNISQLKFIQGVVQIGTMLFPPLLFAYFYGEKRFKILTLNRPRSFIVVVFALLLPFIILPLISLLAEWNMSIKFPEFMEAFEHHAWAMEKQAEILTNAFLKVDTFGGFAVNLLIMAAIPALAEEFLFRGCIQQILWRWFRNAHWAIVVTAIIFSAVHGQMFGFFPRFVLGLMLGYLMFTCNSIWASVIAHFVNNGTIVLIAFLSSKGLILTSYETFGSMENSLAAGLGSTVVTLAVFYFLWRRKQKHDATCCYTDSWFG
jgi:membrane protease YdiL (CAAX protease family)